MNRIEPVFGDWEAAIEADPHTNPPIGDLENLDPPIGDLENLELQPNEDTIP